MSETKPAELRHHSKSNGATLDTGDYAKNNCHIHRESTFGKETKITLKAAPWKITQNTNWQTCTDTKYSTFQASLIRESTAVAARALGLNRHEVTAQIDRLLRRARELIGVNTLATHSPMVSAPTFCIAIVRGTGRPATGCYLQIRRILAKL